MPSSCLSLRRPCLPMMVEITYTLQNGTFILVVEPVPCLCLTVPFGLRQNSSAGSPYQMSSSVKRTASTFPPAPARHSIAPSLERSRLSLHRPNKGRGVCKAISDPKLYVEWSNNRTDVQPSISSYLPLSRRFLVFAEVLEFFSED